MARQRSRTRRVAQQKEAGPITQRALAIQRSLNLLQGKSSAPVADFAAAGLGQRSGLFPAAKFEEKARESDRDDAAQHPEAPQPQASVCQNVTPGSLAPAVSSHQLERQKASEGKQPRLLPAKSQQRANIPLHLQRQHVPPCPARSSSSHQHIASLGSRGNQDNSEVKCKSGPCQKLGNCISPPLQQASHGFANLRQKMASAFARPLHQAAASISTSLEASPHTYAHLDRPVSSPRFAMSSSLLQSSPLQTLTDAKDGPSEDDSDCQGLGKSLASPDFHDLSHDASLWEKSCCMKRRRVSVHQMGNESTSVRAQMPEGPGNRPMLECNLSQDPYGTPGSESEHDMPADFMGGSASPFSFRCKLAESEAARSSSPMSPLMSSSSSDIAPAPESKNLTTPSFPHNSGASFSWLDNHDTDPLDERSPTLESNSVGGRYAGLTASSSDGGSGGKAWPAYADFQNGRNRCGREFGQTNISSPDASLNFAPSPSLSEIGAGLMHLS